MLSKIFITPVGLVCNLACQYCYNGISKKEFNFGFKMITNETLRNIFLQVPQFCSSAAPIMIIWHGGEPTLAGINFYYSATRLFRDLNPERELEQCMQTNGLNIDSHWIKMFQELDIRPSFSIDGPAKIHNRLRLTLSNGATHDTVMRNYNRTRNAFVKSGLLTVISKFSVNRVVDIWQWIVENRINSIDLLPCLQPETLCAGQKNFSVNNEELASFWIKLFDLWFTYDDPAINIRIFRNCLEVLLGGDPFVCSWRTGCSSFISFDEEGEVFACSRYNANKETSFGNINKLPFSDILEKRNNGSFQQKISNGQKYCEKCEWIKACGGGCPYTKYALYGNFDHPYYFCPARKKLFKHIQKILV